MTEIPLTPAEMGRRGGQRRMAALTPRQRKALATKAGLASAKAARKRRRRAKATLDSEPTNR